MCTDRSTQEQYAVKILIKSEMLEGHLEALFNEVKILERLSHSNVIEFHELSEDDSRFYLLTELCQGGDLFTRLEKQKRLDETEVLVIVRQLLIGLAYIHSQDVIHRDLKPENILLQAKTNKVKISDFGSAIVHESGTKLSEIHGTPYYTAPEVLGRSYDNKCDIWSLGVITYILLSGMAPFYGKTNEDIIKMIVKGQFKFEGWVWLTVSDQCKHFIRALLTVDPDMRPSA